MDHLRRALVVVLILWAIVAPPSASAAGFSFLAAKQVEGTPDVQGEARYELPIRIEEPGFVYLKLLPTDGNAVHNGTRANGSIPDERGWRAELSLRMPGGAVEALGTYVDGTPTRLVAVAPGDEIALLATLHVPLDAARGGTLQKVYVAVAFRLDAGGTSTGTASGGQMDQARAVTLLVHIDGTPPSEGTPAPANETTSNETPAPDTGSSPPPPTPDAGAAPGTGSAPDGGSTDLGAEESTTDPGPVQPLPANGAIRVIVEREPLPMWFMIASLALGIVLLVAVAAVLLVLRQVLREPRLGVALRDRSEEKQMRDLLVEREPKAGSVSVPVEER